MTLLGIDVGTTSVKTALFSETLQQLSGSHAEYALESHGDRVEADAGLYWNIVREEIEKLSVKPDALAIDTQCETLILTDEQGEPVRKAIVWLDNRAAAEAQELEAHFGRKRVYEVTGQPEITATWPACKLLWVKRHEPEVWAKTRRIFLLEDYLLFKLTGRFVTEKTLQSSSLYFDIRKAGWWQEMLDYIGISAEQLPTLCDSGCPVGSYKGIRVVTGAMDQVAGAIGAGVTEPGTVSEMTGTTMVLFCPTDTIPAYDEASIVPCHYNYDGGYCLLLWTPTAGMALKWFKNALCESFSFAELDRLAEAVEPGCNGLTFLPYLCGSTMPKYNPNARGSFTGLTPEHTRGHFARSIMEAVACMLRENLDYLGLEVQQIRAMGGGAASPLWCQMMADMTGKTLATPAVQETACLGSAILAGVGIGAFASAKDAARQLRLEKTYTPSGTDYTEVYRNYQKADALLNP